MAVRGLTVLEHAVLGLLLECPRSGYDLRLLFKTTAMGNFSGGPGAIYPALRRLASRRLIAATRSGQTSRRGREAFRLTAAGREEVLRWLRALPTRDDVVRGIEEQVLKVAFMGFVLRGEEVERFLRAYRVQTQGYARELRSQLAILELPPVPRLALEHGIALYEARSRWAAGAIRTLSLSHREGDSE